MKITCEECSRTYEVPVPAADVLAWRCSSVLIQNAFPELTPGDRELILSRTCSACFDNLFAEEAG